MKLECLQRELADDDSVLKDVTLIGSDGGRVRASKTILAIESPVFRRMFFGNFREAKQDTIEFSEISTPVLRGIVQFCYTGELSCIVQGDPSISDIVDVLDHQLFDSANFFEIAGMRKAIVTAQRHTYKFGSNHTFHIEQELVNRGQTSGEFWKRRMAVLLGLMSGSSSESSKYNAQRSERFGRISLPLLEAICLYVWKKKYTDGLSLLDGIRIDKGIAQLIRFWINGCDSIMEEEKLRLQALANKMDDLPITTTYFQSLMMSIRKK